VVAAAVDTVRAWPELPRYLPSGGGRLFAFLAALYGALFSAAAALLAVLAHELRQHTLLGALWPAASATGWAPVRRRAILASAVVAAAGLGGALYLPARSALQLFHHPTLTALLVGAIAAGLAVPAALVGLIALSLLTARRPPTDAGEATRTRGPLSLYALGWTLSLLLLAGGVAAMTLGLLRNPRMNHPLRALNLSLWTPALALGALLIGHFVGRLLARWAPPGRLPFLSSVWAAVLLPLGALLAAAAVGAVAYWPTLKLLDLRPFLSGALAALAALALLAAVLRLDASHDRLEARRALALIAVPLVLWGAALALGAQDRVRKAALGQVPLAAQLLRGTALVCDFDRDGVATRWVVGGSDCDDFDPEIHPGALDWPDNGIDENCNGHDAHARPIAPSAEPTLPPGLKLGPTGKPNLVLITIDALRADHVSAYGYARRTTPNLDRLATEPGGTLFRNAWAHAPSTRYSVPAILTGRYPSTIAWGSPYQHWPPEVLPENRLISEVVRDRGYQTTALLSYHYFEPTWGLSRGFADYDTHLQGLHSLGGDPAATSGSSARELADLALQKLQTLIAGERPFFLWVHFYDPHFRYEVHPPPPGEASFGSREIDLYDGEIRYTDQHIGRVLAALQSSPAWDHTAVIVTSDHGEGLGEHGIPPDRRHGYHLYANQTKVPLIIHLPLSAAAAASAPKVVQTPVGHVDLMPTMIQLAGGSLAALPQLAGRSLLPALAGPEANDEKRVVFQEVMYEGPTVRKAVVSTRWHLIQNLIPDGTSELYDLVADPAEERDVQGLHPTVEHGLAGQLAAWIDDSAVPPDFARRVAGNLTKQPLVAGTPLHARIGDYLEVVGADITTAEVASGQTAEVAVVLHALRRIPAGYHLFAHLRGSGGGFVNGDHDLLQGLMPPPRLAPGMYVRDVMRLPVPTGFAAGEATLLLGLYNREGRVPVSGPPTVALSTERAVRAATLRVR
jgi:arylsulfatase A-like enzyme